MTANAEVLKGLAEMLNILDRCPWVGNCECGWRGREWESEADAIAEAWAHGPCFLPKAQPRADR